MSRPLSFEDPRVLRRHAVERDHVEREILTIGGAATEVMLEEVAKRL